MYSVASRLCSELCPEIITGIFGLPLYRSFLTFLRIQSLHFMFFELGNLLSMASEKHDWIEFLPDGKMMSNFFSILNSDDKHF